MVECHANASIVFGAQLAKFPWPRDSSEAFRLNPDASVFVPLLHLQDHIDQDPPFKHYANLSLRDILALPVSRGLLANKSRPLPVNACPDVCRLTGIPLPMGFFLRHPFTHGGPPSICLPSSMFFQKFQ